MAAVYIFVFLVNICSTFEVQTSTHWMITESGLIEPKINSPLILNKPDDLLLFMNQDRRWKTIHTLYSGLKQRQAIIVSLWKNLIQQSNIELHVKTKSFCNKAGDLKRIDWRVFYQEDDSNNDIPESEYQLSVQATKCADNASGSLLDCSVMSKLGYTEDVFDHLRNIRKKESIILNSATTLPRIIDDYFDRNKFVEWANILLHKNPDSWLHYNLASIYWLMKRDANKALECSRRAIYYAPKKHKDKALITMGVIYLKSMRAEAALQIFLAAVKLDNNQARNHFMLANAYTVVGNFENAMKHYDEAVKLKPNFKLGRQYKNAVLCHIGIVKKQAVIRNLVYRLRHDLREHKMLEEHWLTSQTLFVKDLNSEDQLVTEKIEEITGYDVETVIQEGEVLNLKLKFVSPPYFNNNWIKSRGVYSVDGLTDMFDLIKQLESNIESGIFVIPTLKTISDDKHLVPEGCSETGSKDDDTKLGISEKSSKTTVDKTEKLVKSNEKSSHQGYYMDLEVGEQLYPPNFKVRRNVRDFDKDPDWPSTNVCNSQESLQYSETLFPAFLPFENKGLSLQKMLTDKIGVPVSVEHELPWHPPSCPQDKDAAGFLQKKVLKQFSLEVAPTDYLMKKLREYVDGNTELVKNMVEAEIGQRIYAAMQLKLAPKWLLYTLASLYWRIRNNYQNALHCLITANKSVLKKYKDVVLTSLASVYLETGHFEEALLCAEEAYKINMYEPTTNFILAELSMVKKNRGTQMFHLKQVLRVEPNYMDGAARSLLVSWACALKRVNQLEEIVEFSEAEACPRGESRMNVVCEKDGSNCHITNVECNNEKELNTVFRLLKKTTANAKYVTDASMFSHVVNNMPTDRSDRELHYENYQAMMKTVNKLQGCGPTECSTITPEDLSVAREDCNYEGLHISQFVQIAGFTHYYFEPELRLPPELTKIVPGPRKVPECRIFGNTHEDFVLERMMEADMEGWQPLTILMLQLTETLNYMDFVSLGPRITRYIEAHPRSWLGLVAAGWWCGARGTGRCAVRCLSAALLAAPAQYQLYPLRALAALLLLQSKYEDGKHMAYLSFYMSSTNKTDAFFVAAAHTFLKEYDQAIWMYRYILSQDDSEIAAKTCLRATICRMLYGEDETLN